MTPNVDDKLYRARIYHRPWPLHWVLLRSYRSTMVEAAGRGRPAGEPLVHHCGPVDVEVWPLEEVSGAEGSAILYCF